MSSSSSSSVPVPTNKRLFWIFALSSAIYFTQGIEALPSQALFYYMKETLNFSVERIMFLSSAITLAWLVKPLIGYVIDNFLNKRIWIFIALASSAATSLLLGFLSLPIFLLVAFLLINSTNSALRDVAVDGVMCVEGKRYKATGRIQSVQWLSISLAGLVTGIGGGFVAQRWSYQFGFLCLVPVYLLVWALAFRYKEDDSQNRKGRSALSSEMKRLFSNRKIFIVSLFIFLYKFSPSFGIPLLFIQRDTFKWSKIWIGALGTAGTIFGIIGSLVYYRLSTKINIKRWLFFSVFLGAASTASYLHYTQLTAVIYDVLYNLIGMFIFLMLMDFMAQRTLEGLEATSFALLCSVSNLAVIASSLSGAFLLPIVGLKWLIILSSLTSFLCLFLIDRI